MEQAGPYSDEALVDLVRARENLYDKGRADYKDEEAKAAAWEAVAAALGIRVEECQTRWVRLRERFGRELRLHKRRVPPGKTWRLFPRMTWLERFIQPRNRIPGAKTQQAGLTRKRGPALGLGAAPGAASVADGTSTGEDSVDGMGSREAPPLTAGPLWPQTFKLWAGEPHPEEVDDDRSHQDMVLDMEANHHSQPDASTATGTAYRDVVTGSLPSPPLQQQVDFQDAVRDSLAAMAGSLEGVERHLQLLQHHALDPDELFARSLAATLRRLPRTSRSQAKMKLIAVLAEFEDGL